MLNGILNTNSINEEIHTSLTLINRYNDNFWASFSQIFDEKALGFGITQDNLPMQRILPKTTLRSQRSCKLGWDGRGRSTLLMRYL